MVLVAGDNNEILISFRFLQTYIQYVLPLYGYEHAR